MRSLFRIRIRHCEKLKARSGADAVHETAQHGGVADTQLLEQDMAIEGQLERMCARTCVGQR